jgi:hypothetical protein
MQKAETPNLQPMGPLEEGDQAVVDAVRKVERTAGREGDTSARVSKIELPDHTSTAASITTPDGNVTVAGGHIYPNKITANVRDTKEAPEGMSVGQWLSQPESQTTETYATNNTVIQDGQRPVIDRHAAQAVKLEAARRIEAAQSHIEQTDAEAAQR